MNQSVLWNGQQILKPKLPPKPLRFLSDHFGPENWARFVFFVFNRSGELQKPWDVLLVLDVNG